MEEALPTLGDLSLHAIAKQLWHQSELPNMLSKYGVCLRKSFLYESEKRLIKKHNTTLSKLQQVILGWNFLPQMWKFKIVVALENLDIALSKWIGEMIVNEDCFYDWHCTEEDEKVFCSSIVLDQHLNVDARATILKIFYVSAFAVKVKHDILIEHFIDEYSVQGVVNKLHEEHYNNATIHDNFYDILSQVQNIDSSFCLLKEDFVGIRNLATVKYLKKSIICKDSIEIAEIIEEILIHTDALKHESNYSPVASIIVFLKQFIDEFQWMDIAERQFNVIFTTFLNSWTHRKIAVELFYNLKDVLTYDRYKSVVQTLQSLLVDRESYETKDVMITFFQNIWDTFKEGVQNDLHVAFVFIPRAILALNDIANKHLSTILEGYEADTKATILSQVMLYLIVYKKEAMIPNFIEMFKSKDILHVKDYKDLLDESAVRTFIIYSLSDATDLHSSMKLIDLHSKVKIKAVKKAIKADKEFVLSFYQIDRDLGYQLIQFLCDYDRRKIACLKYYDELNLQVDLRKFRRRGCSLIWPVGGTVSDSEIDPESESSTDSE